MKITLLDRALLLITGLLAAWQVAVGINGVETVPMTAYTVGFGVLLIADLLLIILGLEALDTPVVVVFSTLIPVGLALGLGWEYLPVWRGSNLGFAIVGFLAVLITRTLRLENKLPVLVLGLVHGVAGLTIFLLPLFVVLQHNARPGFLLVSLGGMLIGVGGILLGLLKTGNPLLSHKTILRLLPALLLAMTAAFVAGFAWS